jgi:hypothetical protein
MTPGRLFNFWQNLSFWRRWGIESSFCVFLSLLISLLTSGLSADLGEAVLGGLVFGLFYSVVDHVAIAPSHTRTEKRNE